MGAPGSGLRAEALELSRRGSCSATLSGPPLPYLRNGIMVTLTLGTAPNASRRVPGPHLAFRKHGLLLFCTISMIGVAAVSVTFTPRGRVLHSPFAGEISCTLSFHKYCKVQTRFLGEGWPNSLGIQMRVFQLERLVVVQHWFIQGIFVKCLLCAGECSRY